MNAPKWLRIVGWTAADLITAIIGTVILDGELGRIIRVHTPSGMIAREMCLSIAVAMFLGLAGYMLRPHGSGKWIWVLGISLLAVRAMYLWDVESVARRFGTAEGVFSKLFGRSCGPGAYENCIDWIDYTIPSIRIISYSAGCWIAWRSGDAIRRRVRAAVHVLEKQFDASPADREIDG